jgi:hypothetical protein
MTSSPPSSAATARFKKGDAVRTPSGRFAKILRLDGDEALVQWCDGDDHARLRLKLLRPMPGVAA